jgi:hypothetical protein
LLLAANAIAMPYLGFIHEARLYAGQVLNTLEPETYGGDLFFQFGSQDRFTLFSAVMAPLTQRVGIDTAFFLGYLLSLGIFLWSLSRLVTRLFPDTPFALLGLFYIVMMPIPYGGLNVFHVLETFFTSRLPASALTLLGIDFFLGRRWWNAAACFLVALAIHPIMAFPGVVLAVSLIVWDVVGTRGLLATILVGGAALAALLAYPPAATRLLGTIDAEWREAILLCTTYHFPREWALHDWVRSLFTVLLTGIAAFILLDRESAGRRFLVMASILGLIGLTGQVVVAELPYWVPLMGQPYRFLWIATAFYPAAGFALAERSWRSGQPGPKLITVGIVAALATTMGVGIEWLCFILPLPVVWYAIRIFDKVTPMSDLVPRSLLISVVIGTGIWGLFRFWVLFGTGQWYLAKLDPNFAYETISLNLGPLWILFVLGAISLISRLGTFATVSAIATAVLVHSAFFLLPFTETYQSHMPKAAEVRFVREYLNERRPAERPLCVYSNLGLLNNVWLDWRCPSYYDICQTAGVVFGRATAMEAKRRAPLVGPFEFSRYRLQWDTIQPDAQRRHTQWHDWSINAAPPSRDDLLRLCADEHVDFLALWNVDLPDLRAAHYRGVSIYDCRALRSRAGSPTSQ